jgi:hypothetical protein
LGTSQDVLAALAPTPGLSLLGPLQPFPHASLLVDVLTVLVQSEAAWTLGGLHDAGVVAPDSHWYGVVGLGQAVPVVVYFNAQRARRALLRAVEDFFAAHGLDVLLHPALLSGSGARATSDLATLLGLPQLILPSGFVATGAFSAAGIGVNTTSVNSSSSSLFAAAGGADVEDPVVGRLEEQRRLADTQWGRSKASMAVLLLHTSGIIGLPGGDAAVLLAGAVFQSSSCCHLVRPGV